MPGIATHFEVLALTLQELRKPTSGPALNQVANVMDAHPEFAHLGAIGPAIADFLPSPAPRGTYLSVWTRILRLLGGDLGLHNTLKQIEALLCDMDDILNDEDFDRLKAFSDRGDFDKVQDLSSNFADIVQFIPDVAKEIADTIRMELRPNVCTASKTDPVPGPETWQIRDLLHWKHSGLFVKKLLARANASGNPRHLAYAYGFVIGYSANVCGAPFVNSTVGGPSRTQWWRQRLVKNWVDAWVYGFYRAPATMPAGSDTPVPDYDTWPNLCDANLQKRIEMGALGPEDLLKKLKLSQPLPEHILPDDFGQFWIDAFADAYGPLTPNGPVSLVSLNHAYLMTWLVLWFQTSGQVVNWFNCSGGHAVPICQFKEPPSPPGGCTFDPNALDPFQKDPKTGKPLTPPKPHVDTASIKKKKKCALITQIIGAVVFFGASVAAGAVIFGIGTANNAAAVDWKDLRCQLFKFRMYLFNGLQALHELLAITGFGYPHAAILKDEKIAIDALAEGHTWKTGKALVKSQIHDQTYPSKPLPTDRTIFLLGFNDEPDSFVPGFETPRTVDCPASVYPSFFINEPGNPLSNGGIKTKPASLPSSPFPVGNAVANAVDLLTNLNRDFPDWNLDADRGMSWAAWKFGAGLYDPDAVDSVPQT